jgi:hypothetical protein
VSDVSDDSDVRNDVAQGSASAGVGVHGQWGDYGGSGAVNVGPVDVLRFDPVNDLPPGLNTLGALAVGGAKLKNGDAEWSDLLSIAGSAADTGLNVLVYAADPLNFLISAGLTFLIDVVQPLDDLLGLVTGNPERMEGESAKWERVATALDPLAQELRDIAEKGLVGWEGKAAAEAKARLLEFAEGMGDLANDIAKLQMIMNIAKMLMEIAQAFLIGVMATFVEWLVYTWTAALAAAGPTLGGSTAAAGAATGIEGALVSSRAATFITRIVELLKRLRTVLGRIHGRGTMARVQSGFRLRGPDGRYMKGWVGAGPALHESFKDWKPAAQAGIKAVSTGISEGARVAEHGFAPDGGDETGRKLDPNR